MPIFIFPPLYQHRSITSDNLTMHPHFTIHSKTWVTQPPDKMTQKWNPFQSQQHPALITWCLMCSDAMMTSVICHPDYPDVTMPCRSAARLTLDVTMSHISIKMRVVTAWPGCHVPCCPNVTALLGFIRVQTQVSRDQSRKRKETQSIVKYGLPRPHRLLATYL